MTSTAGVIDDRSSHSYQAATGTSWALLTDTVMGGVSRGRLEAKTVEGRPALRMTGLELDLYGNGETYGLHLRTTAVTRPWQSYRQTFIAPPEWTTLQLPFTDITPHRLDTPFDPAKLRRLGLVAIGRPFEADLALGGLRFYKD